MRLALKLLASLHCGSGSTPMTSVANGMLLVHSQEQSVPSAMVTDRYIQPIKFENGVKHQFTNSLR